MKDSRAILVSLMATLIMGCGLGPRAASNDDSGQGSGDASLSLAEVTLSELMTTMVKSPAGEIYIASDYIVRKLDAQGNLDESFGEKGVVDLRRPAFTPWKKSGHPVVQKLILLDNGKIAAVGGENHNYSLEQNFEIKLYMINPDGTLDQSFATEGRLPIPVSHYTNEGYEIAGTGLEVLPSGNFLISSHHDFGINLYLVSPQGDILDQFQPTQNLPDDYATRTDIFNLDSWEGQSYKSGQDGSGNVYVLGSFRIDNQVYNSTDPADKYFYNFGLLKLNPDGSQDMTYANTGIFGDESDEFYTKRYSDLSYGYIPRDMAVLADGSLFIYGELNELPGTGFVLKVLPDGSADTSFGEQGMLLTSVTDHRIESIEATSSGGFVLSGGRIDASSGLYQPALFYYESSGLADASYGTGGLVQYPAPSVSGGGVILEHIRNGDGSLLLIENDFAEGTSGAKSTVMTAD